MAQARKRRGEKDLSRITPVKIKRMPPGVAKSKILHLLLELEDTEEYSYSDLVRYLVRNGIPAPTAEYYVKYFSEIGVLEKIMRGVYRVNKEAIRKLLEELEH
jgi:DNA-binding transcriptional ArsR family regulator